MDVSNMEKHKRRKGLAAILVTLFVLVLVSGGYFVYQYKYADLNTLKQVAAALPASISTIEVIKFKHGDEPINDQNLAVNNHFTVVEYTQKGCVPCARLKKKLTRFLKVRKDVAIREIAMPENWFDTAERDYGRKVFFTPYIVIYGLDGKVIRADRKGKPRATYLLNKWIKTELEKKV
jgi:hypothetical protein